MNPRAFPARRGRPTVAVTLVEAVTARADQVLGVGVRAQRVAANVVLHGMVRGEAGQFVGS